MIRDLLRKFARVFWLLPGFLLWAAFPPMGETTDVVFALAPLLWLIRRRDQRTCARRLFAAGFVFWFATLSWMPAIVKNGGPWPLVVLGWAGLAAYCSLYFAAFGWLGSAAWRWAREKPAYGRRLAVILFVEPVLWCGLELVRSRLFGGFAWNQLGVVAVNAGFGAPAALGGVYLCSAVIVLLNGTVAGIAERMWRPEESGFPQLRKWGSLETMLAFALVWALYAAGDLHAPPASPSGDRTAAMKVAMVQRNFPCVFDRSRRENPVAAYSNLLANASHVQPDLVVLPESALCEFAAADSPRAVAFARWAAAVADAHGVLAGGGRRDAEGREYNSAALFTASGGDWVPPAVYDKVHLVPFGEYIPGDKWITALQALAPVGSCTPGELKTLDFNGTRLGVAICFEDTDSAQMRRLAEMGAQVLVFITNDSWFSRSVEAEQHAWQAVARAIETGLPVVRVGNSGVTGTVLPDGRASWLRTGNGSLLVDGRGVMCDRIALPPPMALGARTPYVKFGDKPLLVAFLLLLASGAVRKVRARRALSA